MKRDKGCWSCKYWMGDTTVTSPKVGKCRIFSFQPITKDTDWCSYWEMWIKVRESQEDKSVGRLVDINDVALLIQQKAKEAEADRNCLIDKVSNLEKRIANLEREKNLSSCCSPKPKEKIYVKIVSDGTPSGTRVVNQVTGEELGFVTNVSWSVDAEGVYSTAQITFGHVPVDCIAPLTSVRGLEDM